MTTKFLACLAATAAIAIPSDLSAQCATSGSTFTTLAGGNGQQGNIFDITASVDMTIECVDINWSNTTDLIDIEVWYCTGTSFGQETNPVVWTQLGAVTGVQANGDQTQIDISGNGVTFSAGQTYGIYVYAANYATASGFLVYTTQSAGPTLYTGDHCDILTNAGVFGFFSGTFQTRDFNGTLRTELDGAPTGPSLAINGSCPGTVDIDLSGMSPNRVVAIGYSLGTGSATLTKGSCAGITLDLAAPTQFGGIQNADANGDVQFQYNIPAAACGNITFQALDIRTCTLTNAASI